ncbi:MAG: hypothetical protein PHU46_07060 [Rhodocyclaceae bacterium]|nr:hypothetical protein [Rhodocyclaceae bacterium]
MQSTFEFEQAPPISVPYRFFLGGPPFAVAAGLLLAWMGPAALVSRWNPQLLALVHLLTIGFMLQIMAGALLQVLPVAAGASVPRSLWLAVVSQAGLVCGAVLLVTGFALGSALNFKLAIPVLGASVAVYVLFCGFALARTKAQGGTVLALRIAVPSLVPTVVFGGLLASVFGWGRQLPLMELLGAHVAWAFLGWGLILVMGVSYLVVPMFQLTPAYRPRLATALPLLSLLFLVGWTVLDLLDRAPALRMLLALMEAGVVTAFAVATLVLQRQRRRKQDDVTLRFWRTGMIALLAVVALALADLFTTDPVIQETLEILLGVLLIVGVFMSLINGMLYKIVPFLNWLHLQRVVSPVPNMKRMLDEKAMSGQFRMHLASLVCVALAVFLPWLAIPAGLLLAGSALWLEWNLAGAVLLFRRLARGPGVSLATVRPVSR